MILNKIKSYAKINLALHIVGKNKFLHKIESIIAFIDLFDLIFIKKIKSKKHTVIFNGRFSKNISKDNTVTKLLSILDKKKLLKDKKFHITINKKIPNKSGLGGGSMNAARILKYFKQKKIIRVSNDQMIKVSKLIGSDVVLGLDSNSTILTSKNKLKKFNISKKNNILIVKPNFGCSTKNIYSLVKKFEKPKLTRPNKRMFDLKFLSNMNNSLESVAFSKYPKLKKIKYDLENLTKPSFIRMTGSGSALVAYFKTKKQSDNAKKKFNKKYKNYWCISTKTI